MFGLYLSLRDVQRVEGCNKHVCCPDPSLIACCRPVAICLRAQATSGDTVLGRNPFRTTLKPWLKPLFVGIYQGIIIPGFLRWCRILSIHSSHNTVPHVGRLKGLDEAFLVNACQIPGSQWYQCNLTLALWYLFSSWRWQEMQWTARMPHLGDQKKSTCGGVGNPTGQRALFRFQVRKWPKLGRFKGDFLGVDWNPC